MDKFLYIKICWGCIVILPKFVKKYANLSEEMNKAFTKYIEEVKDGVFPGPEHGFKISDDVLEKLY